ncbi:MAG: hypothetical protein GY946_04950 [bacterium]|nr:hypothetical protein [bacterium]
MGVVVTPIPELGAVTEPDAFALTLPTADSTEFHIGAPISTCRIPGGNGVLMVNGIDPMRHVAEDTMYGTSLLAPSAAPTATPSGTQATATLDLDDDGAGGSAEYTIINADKIKVGPANLPNDNLILFTTTLDPAFTGQQILIGASNTLTLDNLQEFLAGDTGSGVRWLEHTTSSAATMRAAIEVSAKTDSTITFRAKSFGTDGNGYAAYLLSGSWANVSLGSTTTTVGTQGYMTGGVDGSGSAPGAGTYRYRYTYVRTNDGAESGPSPDVTAISGTSQDIDIASLADSGDASVDFIRLYRTEASGVEFFRVTDVAVGGAGTYTDDTPNGLGDGSLQSYGNVAFKDDEFRDYRAGYAPRGRHVALWKGVVWTAGAIVLQDYSTGTANVAQDSASVTLSATAVPTDAMVGDTFTSAARIETYQIMAVSESTRVLTLDRPYEGPNNTVADYAIKDLRDPTQCYAAVPQLFNQWPVTYSPGGVDKDDDDEGVTGLHATMDALLVFSRSGIYRITGEGPFTWEIHRIVSGRGCAAGQTIVESNGLLHWVGPDKAVYAWGGSGNPQSISSPRVPAGSPPQGIDRTMLRSGASHMHLASGISCHTARTVRWNLPLDGEVSPGHAVIWDLGRVGEWSTDRTPQLTSIVSVLDEGGERVRLAGDSFGFLWQTELSAATNSDGAFGFEPVQTLTSGATVRSGSSAGTPFPTTGDGLDGVPFLWVSADGALEWNRIISNTSAVLTFAWDLSAAPDDQDQVVVGGLYATAMSGRYLTTGGTEKSTARDMKVLTALDPLAIPVYMASAGTDETDPTVPTEGDNLFASMKEQGRRTGLKVQRHSIMHQFRFSVIHPGVTTGELLGYELASEPRR